MAKKIGRNALCWCGSGKKYKKCHYGREQQPQKTLPDLISMVSSMKKSKECYVLDSMKKDCSKMIVRAHTVPKFSIKSISQNGHVYGLKQNFYSLIKNDGKIFYEKIGINDITTFTGFCQHHDNHLFKEVENNNFIFNAKTAFLLLYRSSAREYYTKIGANSMIPEMREMDKGGDIVKQLAIQKIIRGMEFGQELSLRDMDFHRKEYFEMLEKDNYSNIRAVSFNISTPPPIMCSGNMFPKEDIDGNTLQRFGDLSKILDEVSITSFYDGKIGRIVFAWSKSSDGTIPKFISSFLNKDHNIVLEYIFQYILQNFENIVISPLFWDALNKGKQDTLNSYINPFAQPNFVEKDFYFNPSLKLIDFPCLGIEKINFD